MPTVFVTVHNDRALSAERWDQCVWDVAGVFDDLSLEIVYTFRVLTASGFCWQVVIPAPDVIRVRRELQKIANDYGRPITVAAAILTVLEPAG